jgi:hypothetical protein
MGHVRMGIKKDKYDIQQDNLKRGLPKLSRRSEHDIKMCLE